MKTLLALCFSAVALSAANPASNMKLVFSDEFDGDKLDATKWVTVGEPTAITPFKAAKINGIRISLIKKEDMIQTNGISTRGKFEQARGYFEASIRMNGYKGHGASLILRAKDDKVTPNINLYWESSGGDYLTPWGRYLDDKGQHELRSESSGNKLLKAGESSKKFNTYGFLWTEKGFTWFLNGKPVHKVDRPVVDAPMTLGINHRCGEWERPNLVVKNLPDDVEVDWVKIWK
jgi:beta-glucanase (GH16 family)